jgi:putative phage-type endonuclease
MAGTLEIVADLDVIPPRSPQWHELRRAGIGGSDAAAVCGLSKYKTPYQVWAEKISEAPPAVELEEDEPDYITAGKILEAPVRDWFSRRTGINVIPFPRMVRNTATPFALANVDGLTGESMRAVDGVYEGKTSRFDWSTPDGEVEVPFEAGVQGQHYLAVLGLDVVHYACLVGGQKLVIAEVARNDKIIEDMLAIEEAFWTHVVNGTPPPVEAGDVDHFKKRWQPEAGKSVELTGTYATALQVRAGYKGNIRALEEKVKKIDAEIMAFMGDAEVATFQGETLLTWKNTTRSTPDWQMIANRTDLGTAENAKEMFSKTTASRRFLPKEINHDHD